MSKLAIGFVRVPYLDISLNKEIFLFCLIYLLRATKKSVISPIFSIWWIIARFFFLS